MKKFGGRGLPPFFVLDFGPPVPLTAPHYTFSNQHTVSCIVYRRGLRTSLGFDFDEL